MGSARSKRGRNRGPPLSAGRPPLSRRLKKKASLTSSATRALIRKHHRLGKELHKAESIGDEEQVQDLRRQIEEQGGIESYQEASILGQSRDRGGDSSVVLMDWLKPVVEALTKCKPRLRLLEVGALSTSNACTRSHVFEIEHIDLNSQAAGIKQQDLMQRPPPHTGDEQFNIISLSLVLNFVPDILQRGDMLRRCRSFLRSTDPRRQHLSVIEALLPALFIVLPLPCINNSRYMDARRFSAIMKSLGFELRREKQSAKLFYTLWQLVGEDHGEAITKQQINPGAKRNNFSIALRQI